MPVRAPGATRSPAPARRSRLRRSARRHSWSLEAVTAQVPPDGKYNDCHSPRKRGIQYPPHRRKIGNQSMSTAIQDLLAILDLEPLEHNLFRGRSPQSGWQRVFGGQVIGQALVAAARTVEGRDAHSLHAYFMRPGDPAVPIIYEVDRIRDGKSFATRWVVAIQHGEAIFSMSVSFQV